MNRRKTRAAAVSALALACLMLSGCGGSGTSQPTVSPSTPVTPTVPTLRVPAVTSGNTVTVEVSGGKLPAGTTATVYQFQGGWDGKPPTCDDPQAFTQQVVLTGDGQFQQVQFGDTDGITYWVLVAGKYVTRCGDPKTATVVKVRPVLNPLVGGPAIPTGQPSEIEVDLTSAGSQVPVSGTLTILGPWPNLPEAQAADCKTAPVAASLPFSIDYKPAGKYATVTFTPTAAGVYTAAVRAEQTPQTTAVDTCADGAAKPFTVAP